MALKYTPVCLFKAIFIKCQSYMILGPEHGNIGLIQSSLKTYKIIKNAMNVI